MDKKEKKMILKKMYMLFMKVKNELLGLSKVEHFQ